MERVINEISNEVFSILGDGNRIHPIFARQEATLAKTKKPKSLIPQVSDLVREIGVHPVARAMGVQAPNVYRLISGERDPQLSTIERLLSSIGYRLEIVPVDHTRDDTRK